MKKEKKKKTLFLGFLPKGKKRSFSSSRSVGWRIGIPALPDGQECQETQRHMPCVFCLYEAAEERQVMVVGWDGGFTTVYPRNGLFGSPRALPDARHSLLLSTSKKRTFFVGVGRQPPIVEKVRGPYYYNGPLGQGVFMCPLRGQYHVPARVHLLAQVYA